MQAMDWNLRAVPLSPDTPLWVKVLPLAFVALVAWGVLSGAYQERQAPPGDVSSQVRPN